MSNYVYIATSLDGYIATWEGGLEWLYATPNPTNDDYGYGAFISGIDAIVMGRKTFEKILTFDSWPYARPVFVLSKCSDTVSEDMRDKAERVSGELTTLVSQLNERGYHNLYIDGGRTIRGFLAEDLIDEIIITRMPILLGNGIPLFSQLPHELLFEHQKTEVMNAALVKSHYVRAR